MTQTDRKELIAWLENRYKETPMPGAKRMFRLALEAVREQVGNEPLTCDGCVNFGTNQFGCVGPDMCIGCARQPRKDLYRRPPKRSENE